MASGGYMYTSCVGPDLGEPERTLLLERQRGGLARRDRNALVLLEIEAVPAPERARTQLQRHLKCVARVGHRGVREIEDVYGRALQPPPTDVKPLRKISAGTKRAQISGLDVPSYAGSVSAYE